MKTKLIVANAKSRRSKIYLKNSQKKSQPLLIGI